MPYATKQAARAAAAQEVRQRSAALAKSLGSQLTSADVLVERARTTQRAFDVFLSHSHRDADLALGAAKLLEGRGLAVYVDWVVDRVQSGRPTTSEHATMVRDRMRQSASLLYLYTDNSLGSRWTPWEIGYFDALRSRVAVYPVLDREDDPYESVEYLGLYPVVELEAASQWELRTKLGLVTASSGPRVLVEGTGLRAAELRTWAPRPPPR